MSEENRIGTYQFVAEPFHVDFNGRLTMGVLHRYYRQRWPKDRILSRKETY